MANDSIPLSSTPTPLSAHHRHDKPIHYERPVKVICIGAGASGLLLAYKLQRSFENFDLVLYEKNDGVSGTWYENRYPGCACDIAAHVYTWSFEPNPSWSSVYAGAEEVYHYFRHFSEKYDLGKYIELRHKVTKAVWDAKKGRWTVEITNLADGSIIRDTCDILVNAGGVLNAWKWPEISGIETYKGKLVHTANWDASIDLRGKHVGVIGNGSSGIQVLPAISSQASKITAFLRGPAWVFPAQSIDQRVYSDEERRVFETDPNALLQYRKEMESTLNSFFTMFIADSDVQKATFEATVGMMKEKVPDENLQKLIIPSWSVGCRRITPGINYLETLTSEKVDLVFGTIKEITEKGCIGQDGQEHPVDVLICATGFDTSYVPRFPIIGSNGIDLREAWSKESKSYLGMAAHGFPNYLMFVGPNSPVGNGPVLVAIEAQADYICKLIDRWQTENIHSFAPKLEAVEDFVDYKDEFMKSTVWHQECRSWYKADSATGKVTALWPGSSMHFQEAIAEPRYDDWDIKYTGNRFAFLGNGYSRTETDTTADWSYYIKNEDDSPYLSRGKRRKVYSKSGTVNREAAAEALML
ncbi:FAD-binding monooxygenase moxY [Psilocybe cubensis]|uniref:FAD-binding monooxygenase moxY n=2 Tax=Psilocybe cubensis TaxID=181762 RepID=A0ACB8GUN2_PSICU|nr:FAD-binding monooxygenase moxY [Psilocybe cubensis]KAH9479348.1 FAD-binding monooxygenase moxY [Psilocybe cubensis]